MRYLLLLTGLLTLGISIVTFSGAESVDSSTPAPKENITAVLADTQIARKRVDEVLGETPESKAAFRRTTTGDDNKKSELIESANIDTPLDYYEIAPDTYIFSAKNGRNETSNTGFVITQSSVVVIDTLDSPSLSKRVIATIRKKTELPISMLIVTHNHPNHAAVTTPFKDQGIPVVGHEATIKRLVSDHPHHSSAYFRTAADSDIAAFKATYSEISITGERYSKRSFNVGGKTFDIYNTGSQQSSGNLIVHQVEDNIVWISNLTHVSSLKSASHQDLTKTLEDQQWLLSTFADAALMIPGYGNIDTPPFTRVRLSQDYIKRLQEQKQTDTAKPPNTINPTTASKSNVRLRDLQQKPVTPDYLDEMEKKVF